MKCFLLENNLPTVLMEYFESLQNFPQYFPRDQLPLMQKFLFSTNDESRLKYALEVSRIILKITDFDDAQYFRESLLRREITGKIRYTNQRDHTSHTLYNYLLGIYIHDKSKYFKDSFNNYIKVKHGSNIGSQFISIWPFVSVLHDIGYIFEGSVKSLDSGKLF